MRRAPKYKNVFVLCPAGSVTGGPEALHQLVNAIRRKGGQACISYLPADAPSAVPAEYRGYDIVAATPIDEPENLVIAPEIMPFELNRFGKAQTAIWWLAVDNFFAPRKRPRLCELQRHMHFAQSAYAAHYLAARHIAAIPLSDYISPVTVTLPPLAQRRDAIAYNTKSKRAVAWLRRWSRSLRSLDWILIEGRSRAEVQTILSQVKLFADFGHHPGRDRMPREAAACGACVLTGRRGSAAFHADVPLPEWFKLHQNRLIFPSRVAAKVTAIFGAFEEHSSMLDPYRDIVGRQRDAFDAEVDAAFFV